MDPIEKGIEALKAEREDVKKQFLGPTEEIEALKARIGALEAKREDVKKQFMDPTEEIEALKARIGSLEAKEKEGIVSDQERVAIRQKRVAIHERINGYNNRITELYKSINGYNNRITELQRSITELYKLLPRSLVAETAQSKWHVKEQPDSVFYDCPPTDLFANFLKEYPTHPFSVLLLDKRISEEKKRALAFGALGSAPEDWKPIQDVKDAAVQETVGRFRELMTCTFVRQKLEKFMSAVGVSFTSDQVLHGVDAFLRATYRGFFKECWASEYFFGVTLDLEHVLVCDDAGKLRVRVRPEDAHPATGQRLLTLLHEFAHFFPRFVTAQSSGEPQPYETPPDKKPKVVIHDFPDNEWRKEAGDMFERLLFGRSIRSHLSTSGATQLMKWDGTERLSLPASSERLWL